MVRDVPEPFRPFFRMVAAPTGGAAAIYTIKPVPSTGRRADIDPMKSASKNELHCFSRRTCASSLIPFPCKPLP